MDMSDYEHNRACNVARNKLKLQELGLTKPLTNAVKIVKPRFEKVHLSVQRDQPKRACNTTELLIEPLVVKKVTKTMKCKMEVCLVNEVPLTLETAITQTPIEEFLDKFVFEENEYESKQLVLSKMGPNVLTLKTIVGRLKRARVGPISADAVFNTVRDSLMHTTKLPEVICEQILVGVMEFENTTSYVG
jgi:hypothetical protein